MKKILILGASGFSGKHLISHLNSQLPGVYEIHSVDIIIHPSIESTTLFHQVDVKDKGELAKIIDSVRPEFIINLIGTFNSKNWEDYYAVNVLITKNLLDAVISLSLKESRILLIGSAAEYGYPKTNPIFENDELRPVNHYGLSKVMQTQLALYYADIHGVNIFIARTFNVTGEGISTALSIGSFAKQIMSAKNNDTIVVGNLETERDFLPIEEVVSRYLFLLENGESGTIYNICSGKPKKMIDVVEKMIKESGKTLELIVDSSRFKENDVQSIFGDSSRFNELWQKIQENY